MPKDVASLISKPTKGLIRDERPIPNLNEEFNQYSEYALELIKAKSIGKNNEGQIVAEFYITWSFKSKTS